MNKLDFTEKELEMIKSISPHWHNMCIDPSRCDDLLAPTVFRVLGEQCFIDKKEGPAVESLRRCLSALRDCKLYRHTKEFDDLIQLG